jgi:2,4-dichlorophenol 6-monooxygenase
MGDACHRHPPNNGLGANTSIQDSYNLAWKLALVLREAAGPSLLETYDDERAPVGRQVVERANQSIAEFGAIFEALGLADPTDAEQMRANMEARKDDTPEAADQRERLRRALELKNYEFNAHGVEFNQRYRSSAVASDGTEEPAFDRDPQLYYHPTTWPGARLPHCWVEHRGRRVSTIDLAGKGRFALLTGIGGDGWAQAAEAVSARTGVEIVPFLIGPGRDVLDLFDDWAALSQIGESGCVLVRPDLHVAWRSHDLVADPTADLGRVIDAILGRTPPVGAGAAIGASSQPLTTA